MLHDRIDGRNHRLNVQNIMCRCRIIFTAAHLFQYNTVGDFKLLYVNINPLWRFKNRPKGAPVICLFYWKFVNICEFLQFVNWVTPYLFQAHHRWERHIHLKRILHRHLSTTKGRSPVRQIALKTTELWTAGISNSRYRVDEFQYSHFLHKIANLRISAITIREVWYRHSCLSV